MEVFSSLNFKILLSDGSTTLRFKLEFDFHHGIEDGTTIYIKEAF